PKMDVNLGNFGRKTCATSFPCSGTDVTRRSSMRRSTPVRFGLLLSTIVVSGLFAATVQAPVRSHVDSEAFRAPLAAVAAATADRPAMISSLVEKWRPAAIERGYEPGFW